MENLMQGAPTGGGVIDLEHPIHLSHPSMISQPITLFDPSSVKTKLASDDEDETQEPNYGKKSGGGSSPWQRMKWTDDMVRLLISVVACVGDDGPFDHPDTPVGSKRKPGGACALQKKGKWKTVSKLMLEKGCYVSPQQCEDKFNDLNKRYKKLNDILGRGTTCDVVENPALLDSMPHVPPKAKEDVRKILASKHLFYREMCAYHNGHRMPNSHDGESRGCGGALTVVHTLKQSSGAEAEAEIEEEEEHDDEEEEDGENVNGYGRNSRNIDSGRRPGHANFQMEMDVVLRDGTMSAADMQEWFRKRTVQLEEERVEIEAEAFELEKRRFKWQRFCSKKDRELERMRLENERFGLENQRMTLELKRKEMALAMRNNMELGQGAGFQDGC